MNRNSVTDIFGEPHVPITDDHLYDAWQAYYATRIAEWSNPALSTNEFFLAMQDTAYARFLLINDAVEND